MPARERKKKKRISEVKSVEACKRTLEIVQVAHSEGAVGVKPGLITCQRK
jgi:hypothetical protein